MLNLAFIAAHVARDPDCESWGGLNGLPLRAGVLLGDAALLYSVAATQSTLPPASSSRDELCAESAVELVEADGSRFCNACECNLCV